MKAHFVTFYSPGTFVHETSTRSIDSWNVAKAKNMAKTVLERHNATPYAFSFSTNARGPDDLNSKVVEESNMYFLGGVVETLEEVEARATKDDEILVSNMRGNQIKRVITNSNSWKTTVPFGDDDVLLSWGKKG